jgi:hypothetical protein
MELPSPLIDPTKNKTTANVLNLTESLQDCSHTLWMDNYFNCSDPACFLKTKGTDNVSTFCVNRENVPSLVKTKYLKLSGNIQLMWQSFLGRIKIEWLLFQPTTMVR